MKAEAYQEATRLNEKRHRSISALLIALMMAAAGLTIAQVGHQFVPGWHGNYLVVLGFGMALERFYTLRPFKKMPIFSREWIVALSTQWVINLIFIKLIISFSAGLNTLWAEIPRWQQAFFRSFFTPEYLTAVVFTVLVWLIAGILADLLDEMGLDHTLIAREVLTSNARAQAPPRQRLMSTVFGVGAVLMFLTAVARVDLQAFFLDAAFSVSHSFSSLVAGGAGTLLYFLFGLALLSQGNFITLNTRWFLQHLPVSPEIAWHWAVYSLVFLLLIVVIASLLPTSYSLGLLSVLRHLLNILIGIVMLIFGILLNLITFLLSLLFLLFGQEGPANFSQPPPQFFTTPPPAVTDPTAPIPWLDFLKSVVFWAIFIGVVVYSVNQYLRQHEDLLAALRKFPGWKLLASFWTWVSGLFRNLNRGMGRMVAAGRARLRPQPDPAKLTGLNRFLGLRRLSPRQKVYFYYQALLRRGDETGLPRKLSQTPEEYAQAIERSLPTVEGEIEALTESFSDARYSQHIVDEQEVTVVKSYWEQIRRVFRGRRG